MPMNSRSSQKAKVRLSAGWNSSEAEELVGDVESAMECKGIAEGYTLSIRFPKSSGF